MASGAVVLLVLTLTVLHFHKEENPAEQVAFKGDQDRVGRSECASPWRRLRSGKERRPRYHGRDSKTFADQARAASTVVEQGQQDLGGLLRKGGTENERDLLGQFSRRRSSTFGASTTSC